MYFIHYSTPQRLDAFAKAMAASLDNNIKAHVAGPSFLLLQTLTPNRTCSSLWYQLFNLLKAHCKKQTSFPPMSQNPCNGKSPLRQTQLQTSPIVLFFQISNHPQSPHTFTWNLPRQITSRSICFDLRLTHCIQSLHFMLHTHFRHTRHTHKHVVNLANDISIADVPLLSCGHKSFASVEIRRLLESILSYVPYTAHDWPRLVSAPSSRKSWPFAQRLPLLLPLGSGEWWRSSIGFPRPPHQSLVPHT